MDRAILALLARFGGMGLINLTAACNLKYEASRQTTAPLVEAFATDPTANDTAKATVSKVRNEKQMNDVEEIYNQLQPVAGRLLNCACEKGASSWISTLPIEEHCFCLNIYSFCPQSALWLEHTECGSVQHVHVVLCSRLTMQ